MLNKIFQQDCKEGLKNLPDQSVNCIVTSPPYYGLRDYGVDGQIGLEETPEAYVQNLVEVFREARRVLRDDGTLWLNLGDSYNGSGEGGGTSTPITKNNIKSGKHTKAINIDGLKRKDLIGIPWMVAFALRADGWYLRQDIIWAKPNPMPESVTDRCTKSHEYIFLLSKSARYYYDADAIKEPIKDASIRRLIQDIENQKGSERVPGKTNGSMKAVRKGSVVTDSYGINGSNFKNHQNYLNANGELIHGSMANKKSVWTVTTKPFKESHFATFPEDLIAPCILAGCPEGGIVLDCFMGAGTTALVARKLNRNYVGFELNPDYIKIAENRIHNTIGLFQ